MESAVSFRPDVARNPVQRFQDTGQFQASNIAGPMSASLARTSSLLNGGAAATRLASLSSAINGRGNAPLPSIANSQPVQRAPIGNDELIDELGLNDEERGTLAEKLDEGESFDSALESVTFYGERQDELRERLKNSASITHDQAAGLSATAQFIADRWPPDEWTYVALGRSPVLVIEMLQQRFDANVSELPLGGLSHATAADLLAPDEQLEAFRALVDAHVNPQPDGNYLIVDYAEGGTSISIALEALQTAYPGSHFEMMPMFLNDTQDNFGDAGEAFEEARNEDPMIEAFMHRLRMMMGKSRFAAFESFELGEGLAGRAPVANEGGAAARAALIADLP